MTLKSVIASLSNTKSLTDASNLQRGKRGRPKKKIIKFVEASQELQWTPVQSREESPPKGSGCFPKVCRIGQNMQGSSICVDSITDVLDRASEGVSEERIKNMLKNLGPRCCLVVTRERTLDLTFRDAQEMKSITAVLREMLKETWQIRTTLNDIGNIPYDRTSQSS